MTNRCPNCDASFSKIEDKHGILYCPICGVDIEHYWDWPKCPACHATVGHLVNCPYGNVRSKS